MIEPAPCRRPVTAREDLVRSQLWCSVCERLNPATDEHGRKHARENPDHEVSMTREVEIHYFAKVPAVDD